MDLNLFRAEIQGKRLINYGMKKYSEYLHYYPARCIYYHEKTTSKYLIYSLAGNKLILEKRRYTWILIG